MESEVLIVEIHSRRRGLKSDSRGLPSVRTRVKVQCTERLLSRAEDGSSWSVRRSARQRGVDLELAIRGHHERKSQSSAVSGWRLSLSEVNRCTEGF